jgi:Flp pilus assembly protein CpaB
MYEVKTVLQNVLVLATGKQIENAVPTRVNREVLQYLEEQFEARKRRDFASSSVDQLPTSRPDDNYSNITLQVSPEDAEKLAFLSSKYGDSRLHLVLRNSADPEVVAMDTTILDDVLGPDSDYGLSKRKPPPLPPPKPPRYFDNRGSDVIPVE